MNIFKLRPLCFAPELNDYVSPLFLPFLWLAATYISTVNSEIPHCLLLWDLLRKGRVAMLFGGGSKNLRMEQITLMIFKRMVFLIFKRTHNAGLPVWPVFSI